MLHRCLQYFKWAEIVQTWQKAEKCWTADTRVLCRISTSAQAGSSAIRWKQPRCRLSMHKTVRPRGLSVHREGKSSCVPQGTRNCLPLQWWRSSWRMSNKWQTVYRLSLPKPMQSELKCSWEHLPDYETNGNQLTTACWSVLSLGTLSPAGVWMCTLGKQSLSVIAAIAVVGRGIATDKHHLCKFVETASVSILLELW